jgi:hypothetical protein
MLHTYSLNLVSLHTVKNKWKVSAGKAVEVSRAEKLKLAIAQKKAAMDAEVDRDYAEKEASRAKAEAEAERLAAEQERKRLEEERADMSKAEAAKSRLAQETREKEAAKKAEVRRREEDRIRRNAEADAETERVAAVTNIRMQYETLVKEATSLGIVIPKAAGSVWKADISELEAKNAEIRQKVERKKGALAAMAAAKKQREERIAASQRLFEEQKQAKEQRDKKAAAVEAMQRVEREEEAKMGQSGVDFAALASHESSRRTSSGGAKLNASIKRKPAPAPAQKAEARPSWVGNNATVDEDEEEINLDAVPVPVEMKSADLNLDEFEKWRNVFDEFEDEFGQVPTAKIGNLCTAVGLEFQYNQLEAVKKYCRVTDNFNFSDFGKMVDYIRNAADIQAVQKQQNMLDKMVGSEETDELADMKRREEERVLRRKASVKMAQNSSMFQNLEQAAKDEAAALLKQKEEPKKETLLDQLLADKSTIDTWTATKQAIVVQDGDLHEAAKLGDSDHLLHLIYNGGKINGLHGSKSRPLHWAAWNGSIECMKILLNNGADIDAANQHGYTPLHWAAMRGNRAAAIFLMEQGADLQSKDASGASPLHWACCGEQNAILKDLLNAGANINALNNRGETVLHFAATEQEGLVDIIEILVHAGADWQIESQYPKASKMEAGTHGDDQPVTALQAAEALGKQRSIMKMQNYSTNPPISERERGELSRTAGYKRAARVELAKRKKQSRDLLMKTTKEEVTAVLKKQYDEERKKMNSGTAGKLVETRRELDERKEREYLFWMQRERKNLRKAL